MTGQGHSDPAGRSRAPRLDPLAVRRQLREAGLRPRHRLSQNFLADPDVLQAILDLAAPAPGGRILEVGPGLGILTGGLLAAGADVTAVELDAGLAARLRTIHAAAVPPGRLRLVEADILDQPLDALVEPPYEVVANVPYHISSPLLHYFLGAPLRPTRLVLMLQREVAERIAARAGEMSYLSVFVQFHARVHVAFRVPRTAFEPAPDVDSAITVLEPFQPAGLPARPDGFDLAPEDEADLWRLVQAGFRERRKMLRNVLVRQLPVPAERVETALAAAGIADDRRPQTLGVADWLRLQERLGRLPALRRGAPREDAGGRPGSTGRSREPLRTGRAGR